MNEMNLFAPLSSLQWVDRDQLRANDYNPNKVSEENLKLVRDEMNRYLSWKVDHLNIGRHPSGRIYYIRSSDADRTVLEGSEHLSPWKTLGWVP